MVRAGIPGAVHRGIHVIHQRKARDVLGVHGHEPQRLGAGTGGGGRDALTALGAGVGGGRVRRHGQLQDAELLVVVEERQDTLIQGRHTQDQGSPSVLADEGDLEVLLRRGVLLREAHAHHVQRLSEGDAENGLPGPSRAGAVGQIARRHAHPSSIGDPRRHRVFGVVLHLLEHLHTGVQRQEHGGIRRAECHQTERVRRVATLTRQLWQRQYSKSNADVGGLSQEHRGLASSSPEGAREREQQHVACSVG
mmetsp:Transcript_59668/g.194658  ORF Transcript_59668/g.194658 Transcript_59668/m.194658 type:complete len:251 (-) Transcript_59668:1407-2159(-)